MAIHLIGVLVDVLVIADGLLNKIRHRAPNATRFIRESVTPYVDVLGVASQATELLIIPIEMYLR